MAYDPLREKSDSAYVYAILVDGVVRYIGKGSGGLLRRAREHLNCVRRLAIKPSRRDEKRSHHFHRKLLAAYLQGSIIEPQLLVAGLSHDEAYRIERQTIGGFPDGQLWNVDRGGHGPSSEDMRKALDDPEIRKRISEGTKAGLTEEVLRRRRQSQIASWQDPERRKKIGEASKKRWADPDLRARYLSVLQSDGHREKLSASAKIKNSATPKEVFVERMLTGLVKYTPEKRSEAMKKALASPAIRKKISESSAARWRDLEYRKKRIFSLETIENLRKKAQEQWADPGYRERHSKSARHSDEEKERMRQRAINLWKDPDYRERNLATRRAKRSAKNE